VRQIQLKATNLITTLLDAYWPTLRHNLQSTFGARCSVEGIEIDELIHSQTPEARFAVFQSLGLSRANYFGVELSDTWILDARKFRSNVDKFCARTPLYHSDASLHLSALGLSNSVTKILESDSSGLLRIEDLGWIRKQNATRDTCFLWLKVQGDPRPASDIAGAIGVAVNTAREAMRRDSRFVLLRPDSTWALKEWRPDEAALIYTSATDVIVAVLRDGGPMTLDDMLSRAKRIYPVSAWRFSQTLSDNRIGILRSGKFDLVERGAITIEDNEPKMPSNMAESPNHRVIAVKLEVNFEMLRGSAIGVGRWLSWRLGLRNAPSARTFELLDLRGLLSVRRSSSSAAISTLREYVLELGLVDGCFVALVLYMENDTANLRHACDLTKCPLRERSDTDSFIQSEFLT
jgi:hypothetical protein